MTNLSRTLLADAIARVVLRPYQAKLRDDVNRLWAMGNLNVVAVLPTGGGKTALFSDIMADELGASCAVAHRQELVAQMSIALARNRVRHRIIGSAKVVKMIVRLHMEEIGASYYDPGSRVAVAGVDTLVRRTEQLKHWLPTVKLWVMDEGHHVLKENKWGTAVGMFPNARGLGVTATPSRADGKGLGFHVDGLYHAMAIGPTMRDLINMKFLTDYKLYAPRSDFDRSSLTGSISKSTGEISAHASAHAVATSTLVAHVEKGTVTGDVVRTYKRLLDGKLTIVFAPDKTTAFQLESEYNDAGIPAKFVMGDMGDDERFGSIRMFRARKYLVLINIALFDEGFDLPAIEAVQDVAATESFGRFVQRAGRMLRLMDGKLFGVYVDHVGNIARHATVVHYPDRSVVEICHREWTLDRRERRSAGKSDREPTRVCLGCTATFPRFLDACPECGEPIPEPAQRSTVEFVDGDLFELDAATLTRMRAAVAMVDEPPGDYAARLTNQGAPQIGVMGHVRKHMDRQEVVAELRETMAVWGGYERAAGLSDSEIYRKFFGSFGVDMLTPQGWKIDQMRELNQRVKEGVRR